MYEFTSYYMRSNFSSDDGWRLANDFWFEALQKNKRVTPTVLIYFNKTNVKNKSTLNRHAVSIGAYSIAQTATLC